MEEDICRTRSGRCAVLSQWMAAPSAIAFYHQCGALCRYDFSGLCLPVDGGAMDEPTVEAQPDGRCIQQREREFYAGNAVSGE